MSDVHGAYKKFLKMLNDVKFSEKDTLYIVGDVVDRGPHSFHILDYIMNHDNVELLKGNHELFLQMYLSGDPQMEKNYAGFGGQEVMLELEHMPEERKIKYLEFLRTLPLYKSIQCRHKSFLLTHSGYLENTIPIRKNKQNQVDIQAMIQLWGEKYEYKYLISNDLHYLPDDLLFNNVLIVGHWPTLYAVGESGIYQCNKYINLDNGVGKIEGAQLACLRLDDMESFYV